MTLLAFGGEFEPQIVPKYGRLSQEISERIIAMYGSGMSTGDIAEHISELYQIGIGTAIQGFAVVSNKLGNVPDDTPTGWIHPDPGTLNTEQFYFKN